MAVSRPSVLDDYTARFGGLARLYGSASLDRLRAAHVAVVGVGGVGSWAVEALARSGIGALTLIDLDDVCVTNVNRQLPALDGQIGRPKIDVLTERVRLIHPGCRVTALPEFFTRSSVEAHLAPAYDFIIDAIDSVAQKCELLAGCRARGRRVLTVGGAGGRRDGTAVRLTDLAHTTNDEMLRQLRRKLRQEYDFPRDPAVEFGIPCIHSPELPIYPWADGTCAREREPGASLTMDCSSGFGAATFVTGAFGFAAAGEVVRRIALGVA